MCESELGQTILYNIEINTEDDIARDDYTLPTVFYRDTSSLDAELAEAEAKADEFSQKIAELEAIENPTDQQKAELEQYKHYLEVQLQGIKDLNKKINEWKDASLLDRILDKAPHYSIGHVDKSLQNLQRSFSIDGTDIYGFLTGDCAEQFDCLFKFDTKTRTINAYDLLPVCNVCGKRNVSYDKCANIDCKSNTDPEHYVYDPTYYGEDTLIYVDKENLTDKINFTTDMDRIKNCFKLEAGDDDMTAAIINANPNGTAYMYYLSGDQRADMPEGLVKAIDEYDKLYNSRIAEYRFISQRLYEDIDHVLYYTHSMMPKVDITNKLSAAEALKELTAKNLSPLSLTAVRDTTSLATVESAIKNYAKVFIRTGYFKVELKDGVWAKTANAPSGIWRGKFKVTNYSDETDVAISATDVVISINADYEQFITQKIQKYIALHDDDEGTIYDVLGIKDYNKLCEAIKLYSLNRLISFKDAYQGILDIIIELGETKADTSTKIGGETVYSHFYVPYKQKMEACVAEIDRRQATINAWQSNGIKDAYFLCDKEHEGALLVVYSEGVEGVSVNLEEARKTCYNCQLGDYVYKDDEPGLETRQTQRSAIQKALNFENWLSSHTPEGEEDYYLQFCAYRREDTYNNDNFISDGLSNTQIFSYAEEFIELAKNEIVKSGEAQHSISCDLYNLLTMEEFKPLVDMFELGNWIRVRCENDIYRLRLISYEIKNNDIRTIDVDFSDMTKTASGMNDIQSVLAQASSMSSSYSYVTKQASNGDEADDIIEDFRKVGLDSSLYRILNNSNEEITYDEHGILCRSYDDVADDYSPEQLKLTHNVMAFTTDNWKTVKTSLGKQKFDDIDGKRVEAFGLNADFVVAGYIQGSDIVGNNIYGGTRDANKKFPFSVTPDGTIRATKGEIGGWQLGTKLNGDGFLKSEGGNIYLDATATGDGHAIHSNGTFYVTANGDLHSESGTIGGWVIKGNALQNAETNPTVVIGADGTISGTGVGENPSKWSLGSGGYANLVNGSFTGDGGLSSISWADNGKGGTVTIGPDIYDNTLRIGTIEADYVKTKTLEANYITAATIASTYVKATEIETKYLTSDKITSAITQSTDISCRSVTGSLYTPTASGGIRAFSATSSGISINGISVQWIDVAGHRVLGSA